MSDRSTHLRRPLAVGAAVLLAAATFLATSAGPVGAGGPQNFTLTPAEAQVGDTVTAANVANSTCNGALSSGLVVVDEGDNEVFSASGSLDEDDNWTIAIDTAGLTEGTYTVKAWCLYEQGRSNYQSQTLVLTAADVEVTTTTTEAETTTSEPTTSTTEVPGTTTAPTGEQPAAGPATAAPAGAVASSPNYTG